MLVNALRWRAVSQMTVRYMSCARTTSLLLDKGYINGVWVGSSTNKTFDVFNPSTGNVIAQVADMGSKEAEAAIDAAYNRFHSKEWYSLTAKDRSNLLKNWYKLLDQHSEDLATLMTSESGKPLVESRGEVAYGNSFVEWFAEEARRIYGEIVPSPHPKRKLMIIRQPIGVAALITPWNFPHAMITRKAGAALAAGCTVVIRPAEDTPLTALALAKLAEQAGFPSGAINVITSGRGEANAIGVTLCKSSKVAGVSFTGSTAVGKILYRNCADTVKRLGLELGGNAPFIVFDSANLDQAVAGAMASKFRNCGQTCVSANRFLVQENIYDAFVDKLKKAVDGLNIGDGHQDGVNIGPLINEAQLHKVSAIVQDAREKGAAVIPGGKPKSEIGKLFYAPTILADIAEGMRIYREEVFGPVVAIKKFRTEEEALKIANDTNSGLAGYFFTQDVSQIFRVGKLLEVGMVGINEGLISTAEAAFGGVKESGLGREGSKHGIDDYVELKYLCLGNLDY